MSRPGASLLVAGAVLSASLTLAAVTPWNTPVSRHIPYRGMLELNGVAVSGTVGMIFSLHDDDVAGTQLWTETQSSVAVNGGRFSVTLGADSGNLLPDVVFQTPALFLGIAVVDGSGPVTLAGRQRVHAVPYAVRAERTLEADRAFTADHGVPAGTVVSYVGELAPPGWLVCDGAQLTAAAYPGLYAVIGERFGSGAPGVQFNLPDLRGRFLRGWDNGTGRDPDAAGRLASMTGGATGDRIGSRQNDQLRSHRHTISYDETAGDSGDQTDAWDTSTSVQHSRSINTSYTGGNETRPTNIAVNFIIKCAATDPCP